MADKEKKVAQTEAKTQKPNKQGKAGNAWRGFKSELKKIVWPSMKQISNNTVIVIIAIIIIGCFIWALDFGLGALIKLFLA